MRFKHYLLTAIFLLLNVTNHGNARKPENGFFRFDGQ